MIFCFLLCLWFFSEVGLGPWAFKPRARTQHPRWPGNGRPATIWSRLGRPARATGGSRPPRRQSCSTQRRAMSDSAARKLGGSRSFGMPLLVTQARARHSSPPHPPLKSLPTLQRHLPHTPPASCRSAIHPPFTRHPQRATPLRHPPTASPPAPQRSAPQRSSEAAGGVAGRVGSMTTPPLPLLPTQRPWRRASPPRRSHSLEEKWRM